MKYTAKQTKINFNVSKKSPLKEFLKLLTGLAAIVCLVYVLLGAAVSLTVRFAPDRLETAFSRLFSDKFHDDRLYPQALERMQTIANKLEKELPPHVIPYRIHIQQKDQVNAFAFPGGHIVIFTGLLKKIRSENELAMIIGHELGHHVRRDHLEQFGRKLIVTFLLSFVVDEDSNIFSLFSGMLSLTELKYSREQENAADQLGLELVQKVYGHVGGVVDFFDHLQAADPDSEALALFSTHPMTGDRVSKLQKLIERKEYLTDQTIPFQFK